MERIEMTFLDELREYLEGVDRGVSAPAPTIVSSVDIAVARRYFLDALERADRGDEKRKGFGVERRHAEDWHREWIGEDRLERFVEFAQAELRQGLCAGPDTSTLQEDTHRLVDRVLSLPFDGVSRVRRLELDRIASRVYARSFLRRNSPDYRRYSKENRLTRKNGVLAEVSPVGRVLLDLPDDDAVRWLLTIESAQSLHQFDEWHVHPEVLAAITRDPSRTFTTKVLREEGDRQFRDGSQWPFSTVAFRRLDHLRVIGFVLAVRGQSLVEQGYELNSAYRETLEDLVARKRTPLSLLAETLLADERNSVSGHATALVSQESSAELQARHARMVTHEIRNAIVPMRMALSELYGTLEAQTSDGAWRSPRERVDRGIDRLFRFVNDLEQVARLGSSPLAPFDLAAAIHDAIKNLNGGLGLTVRFEPDAELPRLVGHRSRFTLVIVNLLRNSAQNSERPDAVVHIRATRSDAQVIVTVDDDGPGVPEAHREDIFRQGFALRPGGSGLGLALVREVVHHEMRGTARCEQSDLGGARFVLEMPLAAKENP